jgi:hypothetical protein
MKISDYKIYTLKVERVQNTFKNLNSSEMTLKMLKMIQIYQNAFFGGFHCFFATKKQIGPQLFFFIFGPL